MPGTESGSTVFMKAPMTVQPSTIAASSISRGTDLKNPMNSQVQNGMVKVGYTSTSDHSESCSPTDATTRDNGRNKRVGGTREVRKNPMPRLSAGGASLLFQIGRAHV